MIKIIAPTIQHDIISKKLLKDSKVIVNTKLIPLQAFVNDIIKLEDNNYDKDIENVLINIKDELKILSPYINNESFIKTIKEFHTDMYLFNILLSDLKKDTVKDKDLKIILSAIYNITPPKIIQLEKLKNTISKDLLENVYISKQTLNSNYQKAIVSLLKDFGLKTFKEDKQQVSNVSLYYANNKRSEVEASAQMILKNNLKDATVIVLNKEYFTLVEQVYSRYNLKFDAIIPSLNNTFIINFIKTIKLIEHKDKESVNDFLSSNPFNLDNMSSLIKLNNLFNFDLDSLLAYEYVEINDKIVHQSNLDHYKDIAEKSLIPINQLKEIINKLNVADDNFTFLELVFNYFLETQTNKELRNLQSLLMNNKDKLKNTSNLSQSLEDLILNLKDSSLNINNIVVTDQFNHYYFNKKNVIILGGTANNYPLISQYTGVIDEEYLSDLNFISKTKRFNEQLLQQESIFNAENISIFYPLSSYSGKAIEPSFMLENFVQQYNVTAKRYPLLENDASEFKLYKLNKDLAQKLFFKDKILSGSISSFEQYNNCNYSYFLRSGLKLYPKEMPELSYGYIGSIIHAVMEEVVNRQIENKGFLSSSELRELVNNLSIPLKQLNPNDNKINLVINLLIKQLKDTLNHLKDIEADTYFRPIKSEAKFNYIINKNIKLHGFVDRVDKHQNAIRVIDFKSSNQSLSEKQFKQGLQLQLITYLLALSQEYNLEPAGAFYQTMRLANTNVIAGEAKKTKDMFYPLNTESINEKFLANNRLSGWHFKEAEDYYQTKNYVGGLRENKEGVAVLGKPKNFNTVATILESIYKDIYNNISEGIIDCVPINNPCTYCPFHSICLSKTTENHKEEIFKNQKLNEEINNEVD